MKTETRQCILCTKEFSAPLKEIKRGNAKFCSLSCSSKSNRKKQIKEKSPNCTCAYCKISFYRNNSKFKNSRHGIYFCSRICKDKGQRIGGITEIQPPHYGTGVFTSYRKLALREKVHECERCKYKDVPDILEVHHKDRDRENNSIENLEILCPNCHRLEHFQNRGCGD